MRFSPLRKNDILKYIRRCQYGSTANRKREKTWHILISPTGSFVTTNDKTKFDFSRKLTTNFQTKKNCSKRQILFYRFR